MCAIERNIKLRDYKKWLKTSQIENITNYLKKKKTDSVNEIKKYKKVILKTQQRFRAWALLKKLWRACFYWRN